MSRGILKLNLKGENCEWINPSPEGAGRRVNTPAIIAPDVLKVLNQIGYHGPDGSDPEIVNVDGDPVANLKKPGRFAIAACQSEESATHTPFTT